MGLGLLAGVIALVTPGAGTPEPIVVHWTPDRLAQDWPAAPRDDPLLGAPLTALVLSDDSHWDGAWEALEYLDPIGDVGLGVPWLDIRRVHSSAGPSMNFSFDLAGDAPLPLPDPRERWIAYGMVLDTDADGMADVRIGMDNMPGRTNRAWHTDLATGRTTVASEEPFGWIHDGFALDSYYPGDEASDGGSLRYSNQIPKRTRFYAWAGLIEEGRVIATDYAPNAGWLFPPEDPGIPVIGPTWSTEVEIPSASMTLVATLQFTADGQLLIDSCSAGVAAVSVDVDTIHVSDLSLSESTCRTAEANAFDAELRSVLSAGEISYSLDAGALELRAGDIKMRFAGGFEESE